MNSFVWISKILLTGFSCKSMWYHKMIRLSNLYKRPKMFVLIGSSFWTFRTTMKTFAFGILLLAASVSGKAAKFDSRITSGFSASSGLVKCYVALEIDNDSWGKKICGACLILPMNMLVTAASCVYSIFEGKASAIRFYTSLSGQAGIPSTQFQVDDIFKPADYVSSSNSSLSDIAVIKLKRPITSTSTLQGAWPSSESKPDAFVGENLVVCGHGNIDNNFTRPGSRGLQCTTLRVVPSAQCNALLWVDLLTSAFFSFFNLNSLQPYHCSPSDNHACCNDYRCRRYDCCNNHKSCYYRGTS